MFYLRNKILVPETCEVDAKKFDSRRNRLIPWQHLGLVVSNDCSWREHLDYIKAKAWSRINIMRKLKFNFDR